MININDGVWKLDGSHSIVGFSVRHAGISKVRGKFNIVDARAENGKVTVKVDAASFDSASSDRDAHIKSADFLDVEKYPTIDFVGELEDGGNILRGQLTIKDVSREVAIEIDEIGVATDPFGAERAGTEGHTTISRKDFGLTWNAALETGGLLVGDKVSIDLDVSFIKE